MKKDKTTDKNNEKIYLFCLFVQPLSASHPDMSFRVSEGLKKLFPPCGGRRENFFGGAAVASDPSQPRKAMSYRRTH